MKKTIMIAILALLLAGGGIAFAEFGPGNGFIGLNAEPPEVNGEEAPDGSEERSEVAGDVLGELGKGVLPEDDGEGFGGNVAGQAQDDGEDLGQRVAEAARGEGNDDNGERSDVAKAVHEVLAEGSEFEPGDEGFGQKVAENAQAGGAEFGLGVAGAAGGASGSAGAANAGNPGRPGR